MNYPFNSIKMRRALSLTLVAAMTTVALTGCFGSKKDADPTDDTSANMPNLIDTATEPSTESAVPETEPATAPTEAGDGLAVVKEQLSVRSSPSVSANVNHTLEAGEKVEVLRVESLNGARWAYIRSAEDTTKKGWVNAESLDLSNVDGVDTTETPGSTGDPTGVNTPATTPSTTPSSSNTGNNTFGVVTGSELNIRSEASSSSTKVGSLKYGERVTITETSGSWGKIKQGWISLDYVYIDGQAGKNKATGSITASELTVREGPGTGYNKVSSLKQGSQVEVLEQIRVGTTTWGCIKGGWISMDYVSVNGKTGGTLSGTTGNTTTGNTTTGGTTNTTPNGSSIGKATVTGNGLYIRSGAGTNYDAVGALKKGETVDVYATKQGDGYTWGQISNGWICLNFTNWQ